MTNKCNLTKSAVLFTLVSPADEYETLPMGKKMAFLKKIKKLPQINSFSTR